VGERWEYGQLTINILSNYFDNKIFVIIFDKIFIVMKNVIGTPARGESFFPRHTEIERILLHLDSGNNLQIAASRRIGKTSILFHLLDNRLEGYVYVYVDTEAIDDENEFFKKLLKELLRVDEIRGSGMLKKLLEQGHKLLKRVKSIKLLEPGIEFSEDGGQIDYKEDLLNFLLGMQLEGDKKLIILLDEFPQTIQNIIERNEGDHKAAQKFLQSNREIRLHPDILPKVKFIVTGSIGLNHTVAGINASAFINDLVSVEVGPLSDPEAHEFVKLVLAEKRFYISNEAAAYLFRRIEWLIPFHMQLAIQEIVSLAKSTGQTEITVGTIDKAFDAITSPKNNNHFDHYYARLKKHFKNGTLDYVFELLDTLATTGAITKAYMFELSAKYGLQSRYRQIAEALVYDGYINNIDDHNIYRFNSPILRKWWERCICR
jgi:uncharacterized protein